MSRNLIRLAGKNHQIPVDFVNLICNLEDRADVISVGIGRFIKKRDSEVGIIISGYDSSRHSLLINVKSRDYMGKFFVSVSEENRENVEDYLMDYKF